MKWLFWDGWLLLYLDTSYVYDLIELVNKQLGKFFPLLSFFLNEVLCLQAIRSGEKVVNCYSDLLRLVERHK